MFPAVSRFLPFICSVWRYTQREAFWEDVEGASASLHAFAGHCVPPASPPRGTSPVPWGELARDPRPTGKGSGSERLMLGPLDPRRDPCVVPLAGGAHTTAVSQGSARPLPSLRCPPRNPGERAELCFLAHPLLRARVSLYVSVSAPACASGRRTPVCTHVWLGPRWVGHLSASACAPRREEGQDFLENRARERQAVSIVMSTKYFPPPRPGASGAGCLLAAPKPPPDSQTAGQISSPFLAAEGKNASKHKSAGPRPPPLLENLVSEL